MAICGGGGLIVGAVVVVAKSWRGFPVALALEVGIAALRLGVTRNRPLVPEGAGTAIR
jgi:hypothetical protein